MTTRSNRHIKKFNQLVEVYDPDGVESIAPVESTDPDTLEQRRTALAEHRSSVEALGVGEFFDDERKATLRESDGHPSPADVAGSQREEMLDRLEEVEAALSAAIDNGEMLDTDPEW